jgi:hypothetical protein
MTHRQPAPTEPRQTGRPDDEQWQVFIGFWLIGGLALLVIGVAMFAAVAHSRRLAALLLLAGIACIAVGLTVRRAAQHRTEIPAPVDEVLTGRRPFPRPPKPVSHSPDIGTQELAENEESIRRT